MNSMNYNTKHFEQTHSYKLLSLQPAPSFPMGKLHPKRINEHTVPNNIISQLKEPNINV
ncbi:hypothetical protein Hanom_Chr14g01264771 [Helianthus anomalus]